MKPTAPGQEHQVTREKTWGGTDWPAIQEVDHVAHCVSRSEEGLKVHTAHCYWVLVWERADETRRNTQHKCQHITIHLLALLSESIILTV